MKKTTALILAAALALTLFSCGVEGGTTPSQKDQTFTGEVMDTEDGSALICVDMNGLCTIPTENVEVLDAKGNKTELKSGMKVAFASDGNVAETYPAQMTATSFTVTDEGNGLVDFYLDIIDDLYEDDPGLNGDISVIGLDLSGALNLSDSEKEAIGYIVSCEYGAETVSGTWKELAEQGYIDGENLYFPDGILFSVTVDEQSITDNKFTFEGEKWRSGTGAIFYCDCTAKRDRSGDWDYEVGSFAIS